MLLVECTRMKRIQEKMFYMSRFMYGVCISAIQRVHVSSSLLKRLILCDVYVNFIHKPTNTGHMASGIYGI